MIDFHNELAKFDFFTVDEDFTGFHHESLPILKVFNSTFQRFCKELNGANIQLEEVVSLLAENNESEKNAAELKKELNKYEEENLSLVRGVVSILDQLEDLYRYSLQHEDAGWSGQMRLLWNNTAASLVAHGITRIEGEAVLFNPQIHAVVQIKEEKNLPHGMILEVFRCGYLYNAHVLRKASVVVNKNEERDESNE
ncbi:MAG TPA: nucleotide exchange factor GrpE [Firmicutes bacterium]|jgi:molecular chaperone GrpE (heat shock protein)|nr:nucleotide exchange factor GrpE [Bacillota bacterium]HBK69120.1 nucleotide exchange factor GrpE [Bacillota bacterium]HBT16141.1 nucleotide exchange factor GrpE [Bacillota bacterium]